MKVIQQRHFSVNYISVSETLWVASAELRDPQHDIETKLEVDIPSLRISQASIDFRKYPLKQCLEICGKAGELIGCAVLHELSPKLDELFSGPNGCPNVRHLFGISGPGLIYAYYPQMINEGKIRQEEWWNVVRNELKEDCLAHKRLSAGYR